MIKFIVLTNDDINNLEVDCPVGFKMRQTNGEVVEIVLVPESREHHIDDNSILDEVDFGKEVL